jgi:hypothetical protein
MLCELSKLTEIPANRRVPAIVVSATYRKTGEGGEYGFDPR